LPNEILSKFSASAALDFDGASTNACINSLAAAAVCWCAPVTDASPCPPAIMLHAWIHVHSTAPTANGTVEFYLLRADDNATEIRDGEAIAVTTDHGIYTTAAGVARLRNEAEFIGAIVVDATTDITYQKSFVVNEPGTDWNVMIYNGTGQIFRAQSGSTGSGINWRSIIPEVQ